MPVRLVASAAEPELSARGKLRLRREEIHYALKWRFLQRHNGSMPTVRSTARLNPAEFSEWENRRRPRLGRAGKLAGYEDVRPLTPIEQHLQSNVQSDCAGPH